MRVCAWCRLELPATSRADTATCSRKCRQAVWRLRRRVDLATAATRPMRFAFGDPPYPGRAHRYYGMPEVDHAQLIEQLKVLGPDGWALSTSADALRLVLPLCPKEARVCAWVKPIAPSPRTKGLHNTWEPLIVVGGRQRPPGRRDWLSAQPARGGGDLPGRKPLAFIAWLWSCLGAAPGDELVDVFPGTGIVGRGWAELSFKALRDSYPSARTSSYGGCGP